MSRNFSTVHSRSQRMHCLAPAANQSLAPQHRYAKGTFAARHSPLSTGSATRWAHRWQGKSASYGVSVAARDCTPRNRPTGPVTTATDRAKGKINVPVVLVRPGDIILTGLQPELAARIGARIREVPPYPHALVCTMVDDGAEYMSDATSYDHFTCEARNSPFARGAAETVAESVREMLGQRRTPAK